MVISCHHVCLLLCEMTRIAFLLFLVSICPQVNTATEPAGTLPFLGKKKKNYYKNSYLRIALAVVPSRAVHLIQRVWQTAQVKEKPGITGCTYCCILICIFMKDEKCKC